MELTIDLPDYLAAQLNSNRRNLDRIFEAGLRAESADSAVGYHNLSQVLEFLAGLPTEEEILELHTSPDLQARLEELLEKNRTEGLNEDDEQFWASYEFTEHLVRKAKSRALAKTGK